jgi:hypothetical protein
MSKKISKILLTLLTIAVIGPASYVFLGGEWRQIYDKYFPCKRVITYSLGEYDERFGVSQEDFLKNIEAAEAIWEKVAGKNFFEYKPDGKNTLKVNLIYDYRQEATAKIKELGLAVSDTKATYDSLKAKYEALEKKYSSDKKEYEARVAAFEERQNEYNQKVDYWNDRGGAPPKEYQALAREGEALKTELAQIKKMEENLNKEAGDINALVVVINRMAQTLNINANLINNVGKDRGEEFTEGEYRADRNGEEIDIYEFSTQNKLKRLLAHELGHALGLDHVEDPKAIMYRLNQSTSSVPTTADLTALKTHCGI